MSLIVFRERLLSRLARAGEDENGRIGGRSCGRGGSEKSRVMGFKMGRAEGELGKVGASREKKSEKRKSFLGRKAEKKNFPQLVQRLISLLKFSYSPRSLILHALKNRAEKEKWENLEKRFSL